MFYCNNTIYHMIHPNVEAKYRELEQYDIRREYADRNVISYRTAGFDQKAYAEEIKSLGQVFIDPTEYLRGQGFPLAWESVCNYRVDVWGACAVWVPIANASGSSYFNAEQLDKP